ncbi:MAG: M48 family metalloprotease [Planctomycetota bacterium]
MNPEEMWLLVAGLWIGLLLINLIVGSWQSVEANLATKSLVCVSVYFATLAVLPTSLAVTFAIFRIDSQWEITLAIAVAMTAVCCYYNLSYLRPPVYDRRSPQQLQVMTDPSFLARVQELCSRMSVAVPIVWLWRSPADSPQTLAFAGTVQAPQIAVTDGILQRLSPMECDGIVAHELGHIANRSLWILPTVRPVSCAIAIVASDCLPALHPIPFALALFIGLYRVVSRIVEFDCDLRAARAVGFRVMVEALSKIHAVHPISNTGMLSRLCYATATHPSRDARLWALHNAAPPDDVPELTIAAKVIHQQQRATVAALIIWLLILILAITVAFYDLGEPTTSILNLTLLVVTVTPYVLLLLTQSARLRAAQRRMGESLKWWQVLALLILVALPSIPREQTEIRLVLFCLLFVGVIAYPWRNFARRRLQSQVLAALRMYDFDGAIALAQARPNVVARDHKLRYNVALAKAARGDRQTPILELDALWRDKPGFPLTALLLADLLLDTDQLDRALEIARSAVPSLPNDPRVHFIIGRGLRRLGRLAEAHSACLLAMTAAPHDGNIQALAALLALDRGEHDESRRLIQLAEEYTPGDGVVLMSHATIALQLDSPEVGRAAVERAVAVVAASPLLFLQAEIARLQERATLLQSRVD